MTMMGANFSLRMALHSGRAIQILLLTYTVEEKITIMQQWNFNKYGHDAM